MADQQASSASETTPLLAADTAAGGDEAAPAPVAPLAPTPAAASGTSAVYFFTTASLTLTVLVVAVGLTAFVSLAAWDTGTTTHYYYMNWMAREAAVPAFFLVHTHTHPLHCSHSRCSPSR